MARLPPLAAVRAFEAAARHGNFSRAAEELAMTQAGVSYQIKLLEERLGAKLFARSGRNRVLTPLGQRIAPRVSEAFAGLDAAFAMARSENEAVLTLTTSRTFAFNFLSARLGGFQLAHPDLAVRLDVSDQLHDLASGEIDIAIRGVRRQPEGVAVHFIARQVFTPMASPGFLATHPIASLADLAGAPRITPDDEWWDLLLGDGSAATGGVRFDSQSLIGQAAIAGHGVALLNPMMFTRDLAEGRLVAPLADVAYDDRAFWLCYAPHKRSLRKVRAFREWLLGEVRTAVGDDPHRVLVPA
ncbi:LysR substrate-binding domain-containing protein [Novosphingobium sp. Gsoil 351]|uniref:LysR substrate-binding domain-containing protein n=1 Tax=Novosphingobium sp. Gsoil 351 TaxID=2675225 RepID=UPI0012B48DD3|nr:LysR substrate-binding domain-containing protein [Novosphingobium sp. Gsoil 351]QGN55192.1 LysR family transcriptional regulator [Novosphingobium sp. Gsoil 351]